MIHCVVILGILMLNFKLSNRNLCKVFDQNKKKINKGKHNHCLTETIFYTLKVSINEMILINNLNL